MPATKLTPGDHAPSAPRSRRCRATGAASAARKTVWARRRRLGQYGVALAHAAPLYRLHGAQDDAQVKGRQRSRREAKPRQAEAVDAGRSRGSVPPLQEGEPRADRPSCSTSIRYTLLVAVVLSAQATDAGVNKATPALFAAADTPEKMAALGEDAGARPHQDHRPLSQQGEERGRAVAPARRRAWRRGAARRARRWRRCPASGARPPTSCSTWRSASRPSRSTRISSASATAPTWRRA